MDDRATIICLLCVWVLHEYKRLLDDRELAELEEDMVQLAALQTMVAAHAVQEGDSSRSVWVQPRPERYFEGFVGEASDELSASGTVFSQESPPTPQSRGAKRKIKLEKAEGRLTLEDLCANIAGMQDKFEERSQQRDEGRKQDMQQMQQLMDTILEKLK